MAEPELSTRATRKRDFIAINDEADVQDFSENGHEVAGLQQPINISNADHHDEAVPEIVDQFVIQNVYTQVVNGAPVTVMTVLRLHRVSEQRCTYIFKATNLRLASLSMDKLAAMHSAAACAIQNKITCPHNIVTCGLPTQNRFQRSLPQNSRPRWATYWFR